MEDFFGFINYKKTPNISTVSLEISNKVIHKESYDDYDFLFFHAKKSSLKSLNNDDVIIFTQGHLSNKSKIIFNLGERNKKQSTVSILLKLYKNEGINGLNKLEGQFSLLIFDKNKKLLILYKDKTGLVPMNFYSSENLLIFGSHVSQFYLAPQFEPRINVQGLASYLQFGYILQPLTIFESCYKVQSGQSITFDLTKHTFEKRIEQSLEENYQDKKLELSERDIILEAKKHLFYAITESTLGEKNNGVALSGGYDSSGIAALVQAQSEKPIDTFTIGFEDKDINEAPYAKKIAKQIGSNHHEHYFTSKDALDIVPKLCQIYDEPFSDYAASPTVMTTQLLKENNIKQLIVGDGGDEVFATADDVAFFERIQTLPYKWRKRLLSLPLKIDLSKITYLNDLNNLPNKYQKLLRILSAPNIPQMVKIRNLLFREDELQRMIQDYHTAPITSFESIHFSGHQESVDEIIGSYFKSTMIDGELVKSKSATAYQGIDVKTPYLNHQLIKYMAKVPASVKIKNGIKKHILKEIVHEYIPQKLLDRSKHGFNIPFASWMNNELKELLYAQINEERLKKDCLFTPSSILLIRDKFYAGHESYKYKLWRIFLFQLWYENYQNKTRKR